jgi:hypothetical protein
MSSAEEIGGLLRSAREERGLDLLAVHDRLSRPITLIEALENGDLAALPDQAQALSTLRRYAAFLGLDGDALALQMLDAWSVSLAATGAIRSPAGAVTNVVTAVTAEPDHLRAFTQTGEVPRVGAGSVVGPGGSGAYGYGVPGPPTGTFPVVPRQDIKQSKRAVAKARRRLRAPTGLKVVTWVSLVLVLVVAAGFAIQRWSPTWLVQTHILRVAQPHSGTAPSGAAAGTGTIHQSSPVLLTTTGAQSSSYTVAARRFTVTVATSGKCWVQITSSHSAIPLAEGVQPPGKVLTFPNQGTMTVQVGASAVLVGVAIDGKAAYINAPHLTPYTYTFASAA